jgi:hypothetical protein
MKADIKHYNMWIELIQKLADGRTIIPRTEIHTLADKLGLKHPQWFTRDHAMRAGRGLYYVPASVNGTKAVKGASAPAEKKIVNSSDSVMPHLNPTLKELTTPKATAKPRITSMTTDIEDQGIVPEVYGNYQPFGTFDDLKSIIASKKFYPVFITGPSGNGKSMSVEQACASLGREFINIPMTAETDEGDLLGNYVLVNNEMAWRDGGVTVAARRGAVVCIDEVDYGAQNLSCLQRVLEGKSFILKKKGEIVLPKEGFQIIVTANTKGKGSEDGRYMFTNVLNESFLERFPITFEQTWAPGSIEKKIIKGELTLAGHTDDAFAELLVTWATVVRKVHEDGTLPEVISTRRLVHIARAYSIFNGSKLKAITFCLNRFDEVTKTALIDLYTKLDASVVVDNSKTIEEQADEASAKFAAAGIND